VVDVPVPVIEMTAVPVLELLSTPIVAVRDPVAVGRNTTLTVQEAPTATDVPTHWSSTSAKSKGFAPPCDIPLMNSGAVPALLMVTVCCPVVTPTSVGAKPTVAGDKVIAGVPAGGGGGVPPPPPCEAAAGEATARERTKDAAIDVATRVRVM
jgi:hypothetical protein